MKILALIAALALLPSVVPTKAHAVVCNTFCNYNPDGTIAYCQTFCG